MYCWDVGQFSLITKQKFMPEHLVSQAGGHIVLAVADPGSGRGGGENFSLDFVTK